VQARGGPAGRRRARRDREARCAADTGGAARGCARRGKNFTLRWRRTKASGRRLAVIGTISRISRSLSGHVVLSRITTPFLPYRRFQSQTPLNSLDQSFSFRPACLRSFFGRFASSSRKPSIADLRCRKSCLPGRFRGLLTPLPFALDPRYFTLESGPCRLGRLRRHRRNSSMSVRRQRRFPALKTGSGCPADSAMCARVNPRISAASSAST
jgi:hypothetical protein